MKVFMPKFWTEHPGKTKPPGYAAERDAVMFVITGRKNSWEVQNTEWS